MASEIRLLDRRFMPYAEALLEIARRAGYPLVVTSTLRTPTEQARLYRASLAGKSQFPALPPGRSLHAYGIAFDAVPQRFAGPQFANDPRRLEILAALASVWKSWGGQWGGDAKIGFDPIHFQAKQLL